MSSLEARLGALESASQVRQLVSAGDEETPTSREELLARGPGWETQSKDGLRIKYGSPETYDGDETSRRDEKGGALQKSNERQFHQTRSRETPKVMGALVDEDADVKRSLMEDDGCVVAIGGTHVLGPGECKVVNTDFRSGGNDRGVLAIGPRDERVRQNGIVVHTTFVPAEKAQERLEVMVENVGKDRVRLPNGSKVARVHLLQRAYESVNVAQPLEKKGKTEVKERQWGMKVWDVKRTDWGKFGTWDGDLNRQENVKVLTDGDLEVDGREVLLASLLVDFPRVFDLSTPGIQIREDYGPSHIEDRGYDRSVFEMGL
ncbi:hypothetical protein BSKO_05519 [Bryopsis sp. KO-2023]|nr:hypothetical protein BSKO_05519 [Bryopsis sp. KO-2023]